MTLDQIDSIRKQIKEGKVFRSYVYHCCGEEFPSLYDFRKHLFLVHPEEMDLYFEKILHRETPTKPSKTDIHRLANKGKKVRERAQKKKEERIVKKHNSDAYPTPAQGDYFRLIYTPMGNKK